MSDEEMAAAPAVDAAAAAVAAAPAADADAAAAAATTLAQRVDNMKRERKDAKTRMKELSKTIKAGIGISISSRRDLLLDWIYYNMSVPRVCFACNSSGFLL
jgi:3-oxoacyl-ACP reductase-like protein